MINLENYELFVDKRIGKNDKPYYALYMKLRDKEFIVCFITSSTYDYIVSLSN